jgi:hypothetical protein
VDVLDDTPSVTAALRAPAELTTNIARIPDVIDPQPTELLVGRVAAKAVVLPVPKVVFE